MPNNGINNGGLVSGSTYYLRIKNQQGQYLNTGGPAFENYNASNIANYAVAAATANSAGGWFGVFPANAATVAGIYDTEFVQRVGGSGATGDPVLGNQTLYWDGTNLWNVNVNPAQIWQDTTAGHFTMANSIGKSLFTGRAPGDTLGGLLCNNAAAQLSALIVNGSTSLNTLAVGSTSTFTGAFIANNAGNDIAGISVVANGIESPQNFLNNLPPSLSAQ